MKFFEILYFLHAIRVEPNLTLSESGSRLSFLRSCAQGNDHLENLMDFFILGLDL
jgi:hypothetical protein